MTNRSLLKPRENFYSKPKSAIATYTQQNFLQILSFILIGLGIILRFMQFISGRSLWADEAKLALNIIDRSYLELFQVLDYNQVAPIGFLLIQKLFTQLFGATEFALRLFPFLSGVASLLLIYHLAKRYLNPIAVPIATALLAFLPRQIYYSSEIKQYGSDLMIALLLVSVIHSQSKILTMRQVLLFSGIGAIAIWVSHPAIFILASIALTQILVQSVRWIREKKSMQLSPWIFVYCIWGASFVAFYLLSLSANSGNDTLLTSWASRRAFPASFTDLDWIFYSLKRFFRKPLDFPDPFFHMFALAIFVIGFISLFWKKREALLIFFLPVAITMAAAYLNKYPFYSRVVIFLVPFFVLIMAQGLAWLISATPKFRMARIATSFIGLACTGLLLYIPTSEARAYFTPPVADEEIKPLLQYVENHWQPNDLIYVFQKSQFQFEFHREQFGFQPEDYVVSVDPDQYVENNFAKVRRLYRQDLRQLCGHNRVWVLVSDIHIRDQKLYMIARLDQIGQRADTFHSTTPASSVYLYDLGTCQT